MTVFKKALQIATAFGMLLAGYACYGPAFAVLARALSRSTPEGHVKFEVLASVTNKKSIALAKERFGEGHWTTEVGLPIKLYNADRGFWMYAREYKRDKDGKHVDFWPFAIIMESADGRAVKTATSDIAHIELDKPFDRSPKPGEAGSLRVVHAKIEGNVHLRDDKGTPANPADDLRIGPLTWLEYDEAKLQINSDSDVLIRDDVYWITGIGLLIKLRPKDDGTVKPPGSPNGFEDAQTAYLFKKVHIFINDVGAGGIMPGTSVASKAKPGVANPLDLKCDGLMQIDFPKRPASVFEGFVGPPAPKGPTIAQFSRNVEVVRGSEPATNDQLYSDHLRLTLIPPDKGDPTAAAAAKAVIVEPAPLSLDPFAAEPAPVASAAISAAASAAAPPPKGAMSDLTLKEAVASGHNVRLVSSAQDIKVRCNELIFKKEMPRSPGQVPEKPDTTYFRGDRTTGLIVNKVDRITEGPDRGKVSSFTTIHAIDATIFDDHRGNDYAVIVASGPGDMESRPGPGLNGPIERTAHWNDMLTIRPVAPAHQPLVVASANAPAPPVRKRVTLTGKPGFADIPARATLDGRDKQSTIVVLLKPKTPVVNTNPNATPSASPTGSGAYEIEHLFASRDVLLVTPGKTVTARNDLQAMFVPVDALPGDSRVAPAPVKANASTNAKTNTNAANHNAAPAPVPAAAPAEPARPVEPESRADADRVWARVLLKPAPAGSSAKATGSAPGAGMFGGGGSNGARTSEIDEVRLRGTVLIHQDPSQGKTRGTEIVGEAVDLFNQGGKGSQFIVYSDDPTAPKAQPEPANDAVVNPADAEMFRPLAMVDSDEMVIRGRRIGLDQATDRAWVDGNGSLTQLAAKGLLMESSPEKEKRKEKDKDKDRDKVQNEKKEKPKEGQQMTIFFGEKMRFFGRSTDPTGKVVARAEFYKDVHAENEESTLDCQDVMRTYFDRTIKLVKAANPSNSNDPAAAKDAEPKAELARIDCTKKVVVVNTKRDPIRQTIIQRQRILGDFLTYERLTGKFFVPGEGTVYLYEVDDKKNKITPLGRRDAETGLDAAKSIRLTAGPAANRGVPLRKGSDVVGRTDPRNNPADPARKVGRNPGAKPKPKLPLVLTQVHFMYAMTGRVGSGLDSSKAEDRVADFFGDVEALRAGVADANAVLDPEKPPADTMQLTSQILRVVSEPPRAKDLERDENAPPRYFLKAWDESFAASVDKSIQADRITYDSQSSLLYAYGENGNDIVIAQQDHIGQAPTLAPGRTFSYNLKTGESQLADPKTVAFIDAKTGFRPTPVKVPDEKLKPRIPKRKAFINRSNNIERKGYTGQ